MTRGGYGGGGLPLHARARPGTGDPPNRRLEPARDTEGAARFPRRRPVPGRHCWVARPVDGGPPRPGLLLEWRRSGDEWEGRVVYPVELRRGAWATVEEWLPASALGGA